MPQLQFPVSFTINYAFSVAGSSALSSRTAIGNLLVYELRLMLRYVLDKVLMQLEEQNFFSFQNGKCNFFLEKKAN